MSKKPKIDALRERLETQRIIFETRKLERVNRLMAKYDATEPTKARRQPVREWQDEGKIYDMSKRLLGCNLGRDLERNYSPARGMLHQFRVNVVGSLGKIRVNTPDGDEATAWFNEVWSKDCDFRDSMDWSTLLQNILAGEIRDGDVLAVVDDDLVEDSGKLLTWESDQIVPVADALLKGTEYAKATQDNGILRGEYGKVLAYCVTGKRGIAQIDNKDDVTFWKREQARLTRNPWRLNQGRGIPSLLTPSSNFIDLYEILASELMTAKRASKQYAFVKRENAVTDWDNPANSPEFLPENDGRTASDVALDGANQTTHTAKNYERLEAFTGGLTDYLDPADTVQIPELTHPNVALAPFLETVHGYGGSALGLARAYTILRADSSYTAFRGDMIMTWVTIYWLQKHLERAIADWVAQRVLTWAQRKDRVKPMAAGWERRISWTWPTMPSVDELKESTAVAQAIKNAATNYSELLGPDWRKRMDDLSEQLAYAKAKGIPLSAFETRAGAPQPGGDANA